MYFLNFKTIQRKKQKQKISVILLYIYRTFLILFLNFKFIIKDLGYFRNLFSMKPQKICLKLLFSEPYILYLISYILHLISYILHLISSHHDVVDL